MTNKDLKNKIEWAEKELKKLNSEIANSRFQNDNLIAKKFFQAGKIEAYKETLASPQQTRRKAINECMNIVRKCEKDNGLYPDILIKLNNLK